MITVKATREGLVGELTSSGYVIDKVVPFVALPSVKSVHPEPRFVRITNPLNGRAVLAIVLEVGPHYTDDEAYVFDGARPKAESDGSNGAGIDLGERVWNQLGMLDNTQVNWEFADAIEPAWNGSIAEDALGG